MLKSKLRGFAATGLAVFTLSLAVAAATAPPQVVKVSLRGEADQPMTVNLDNATAKAGTVEFDVSNDAIGTDHEVVLVRLKSKDQKLQADPKTHRIDEKKIKSMGEVAGLKPGDTGKLKVKLAAGDYVLMCNHKSHLELGMQTAFTVTN